MQIKLCTVTDLSENKSIKFTIPDKNFDRDCFLIKTGNEFCAYYNECPHIGIALDWDDNDFFSRDFTRIICKNHGAEFTPQDGRCIAGPCAGAGLKKIEIKIEENTVVAVL